MGQFNPNQEDLHVMVKALNEAAARWPMGKPAELADRIARTLSHWLTSKDGTAAGDPYPERAKPTVAVPKERLDVLPNGTVQVVSGHPFQTVWTKEAAGGEEAGRRARQQVQGDRRERGELEGHPEVGGQVRSPSLFDRD